MAFYASLIKEKLYSFSLQCKHLYTLTVRFTYGVFGFSLNFKLNSIQALLDLDRVVPEAREIAYPDGDIPVHSH